jgi:two-component system, LytTR family, response regulator
MKAILLDDEPDSTHVLSRLLERHCPDVEVLANCNESEKGLSLIQQHRPDLVFLDIEMPRLNGFQVLEALGDQRFMLIFTTAYDQYAVRAFKYSALDYLLKPIDPQDLVKAVGKARERRETDRQQLEILRQQLQPSQRRLQGKIALPNQHGFTFVEVQGIIYVESDGSYSKIFLQNGEVYLVTKAIGEVEEVLDTETFYRAHRQYIINLNFIKEFVRGDGGYVVMKDGKTVSIARNRKEEFQQLFARL